MRSSNLSSQSGLKRHPDNIRLQMQILRQVPHSYFLIKRLARPHWNGSKNFFGQFADAEGVSRDRLRFLPGVASEFIHRANLGLADVVLDTYPYNGATTTLEALWLGLPIVTRVGEQFAARNSYTLMMNAGIQEGIAWTDAEYVEWGVRLGKDTVLREEISYRLRRSRHTSPLWNAGAFYTANGSRLRADVARSVEKNLPKPHRSPASPKPGISNLQGLATHRCRHP